MLFVKLEVSTPFGKTTNSTDGIAHYNSNTQQIQHNSRYQDKTGA